MKQDFVRSEAERRNEIAEFEATLGRLKTLLEALHDGRASEGQQHEAAHLLKDSIMDTAWMKRMKAVIVEGLMEEMTALFNDEGQGRGPDGGN